jgi:predicted ferric reductase
MNLLDLQVTGGLVLLAITLWQLATGLRWIKLGRRTYKIHRWTGITLAILVVGHAVNGMYIAGWIKF